MCAKTSKAQGAGVAQLRVEHRGGSCIFETHHVGQWESLQIDEAFCHLVLRATSRIDVTLFPIPTRSVVTACWTVRSGEPFAGIRN